MTKPDETPITWVEIKEAEHEVMEQAARDVTEPTAIVRSQ